MAGVDARTVSVILFDGFELLDVFGPVEMLSLTPGITIDYTGPAAGPVTSSQGCRVVAGCGYEDLVEPDIVLVPGGGGPRKLVDVWLKPLLEIEIEQAKRGEPTAFQSHMWDGSAETLDDNIKLAVELLAMSKKANTILEIEIGAVGGEEDGIKGEENASLYTTADDAWAAVEALGLGENGRYTTALTFGNVHGAYKPGHVKLRPELLGEIQADVAKRLGDRLATKVGDKKTPFDLVMHGGSGSTAEEIATAVRNGVIKMNVDTDTQYAFTRPVADHMFKNYDGVLKIDGEVGSKKAYDPRAWGKAAEKGMAARVVEACERLGSVGSAKR